MEHKRKEIEDILHNVFEEGRSKERGNNPYHWFNELRDIYTKQVLSVFDRK